MMKKGYVYMISNKKDGVIYIGVTNELLKRIWQHKEKFVDGFSKRYNLSKLVRYEQHDTIELAIYREKQLKNRKRKWKVELIEKINPDWSDLYNDLT